MKLLLKRTKWNRLGPCKCSKLGDGIVSNMILDENCLCSTATSVLLKEWLKGSAFITQINTLRWA